MLYFKPIPNIYVYWYHSTLYMIKRSTYFKICKIDRQPSKKKFGIIFLFILRKMLCIFFLQLLTCVSLAVLQVALLLSDCSFSKWCFSSRIHKIFLHPRPGFQKQQPKSTPALPNRATQSIVYKWRIYKKYFQCSWIGRFPIIIGSLMCC